MAEFYAVAFEDITSTAPNELVHMLASTNSRFELCEVYIFNDSTKTDESIDLGIYRGTTAAPTGGSTNTPIPFDGRQRAAVTAITVGATITSSATSDNLMFIGHATLTHPMVIIYPPRERPIVGIGERLAIRRTSPAAAATSHGTIHFREIGKTPGE